MYKNLLVSLAILSGISAATTASAKQIDLREAALLKRQQRLQLMVKEPEIQEPIEEGGLRERVLTRRALRLQSRSKTQVITPVTNNDLLEAINAKRTTANIAPLIKNTALQTIVNKRLAEGAETFADSLQEELDTISFYESADDCNCAGTSNVFRHIYFRFQNEDVGIERFLERYKDVLLSSEYKFIGMGQQKSAYIVLIGGFTEIPVEEFTRSQITNYRKQVLELVNIERKKNNKAPLKTNYNLQETAQNYAERMWNENFYGHNSPEGGVLSERIEVGGYFDVDISGCNCKGVGFAVGENIAKGQSTPEEVMQDWMNSPGHRKNILSDDFAEIGIGLYGNRWVQNFGAIRYE